MRPLIVVAALVLGVTAHAQPRGDQNTQGANSDQAAMDPATQARLRMEGAAGGTGARVPPEANGGATVGPGRQHRQSAAKPPDTQQPRRVRREKSSEREEDKGTPRTSMDLSDPATMARVRMEGAAGGTGARIPEEASGGSTAGAGHQHRH